MSGHALLHAQQPALLQRRGLSSRLGPARRQQQPFVAALQQAQRASGARTTTSRLRKSQQRAQVRAAAGEAATPSYTCALIFDCDGVIVETEDLHRRAYNAAFEAFGATIDGVPVVWDVPYYDILQNTVGGGKPKMKWHFAANGWPATASAGAPPESEAERDALVDALQDRKTEAYKAIVESGIVPRPGVIELMDEALARPDVAVCICSAATKEGFEKVVNSVVRPERLARFDVVMAGDDVSKKKPDPMIYSLAAQRLGVDPARCLVIEDSLVGLRAAQAAGMHCIITPTSSTADAPFCEEGAAAVLDCLGGGGAGRVAVDDLFARDDAGVTVPRMQPQVDGNKCQVWASAVAAAATLS